ncbi:hypothetical protein HK405_005319 [Cladochytrium tenue]|nr:hypothetical protein HK405_005319 [Cladochytrium tenue]
MRVSSAVFAVAVVSAVAFAFTAAATFTAAAATVAAYTVIMTKRLATNQTQRLTALQNVVAKYSGNEAMARTALMTKAVSTVAASPSAASLQLYNWYDDAWTTDVTISGNVYPMILDTGSSDTWVLASGCEGDTSCNNGLPKVDVRSLRGNASYKNEKKAFLALYGLGAVAGEVFTGPVALGSYTSNVAFGLGFIALNMNLNSGIVGLGYQSISDITYL